MILLLLVYDEYSDLVKNNETNSVNDNIILDLRSIEIKDDPTSDNLVANKKFVDNIITHESLLTNTQHFDMNDFNLTNVRFLGVNQRPQVDSHVVNLEYFTDKLDENSILGLNDDSNEKFLQARVGNTAYKLQIHNKTQIFDTTENIYHNKGDQLLQKWKIICNNENNEGKPQDFIKSTKTKSATALSGATSLPPIGAAFMYIETSQNNHNTENDDVRVSFEKTDISNITF